MSSYLKRFSIRGLHGYLNLDVEFEDNTLILIGENGSGKTTVLRLLFYFLTGKWALLNKFSFQYLELTTSNNCLRLNFSDIQLPSQEKISFIKYLPPNVRRKLMLIDFRNVSSSTIEELSDRYNIPIEYLLNYADAYRGKLNKHIKSKLDDLDGILSYFNVYIMHLPTFRRIEQELHILLGDDFYEKWQRDKYRHLSVSDINKNTDRYIEVIEFGMQDVQYSIDRTLLELKEFARQNLETLTLSYLGDIVDKKYSNVDLKNIKNTDLNTIFQILERVEEHILSEPNKAHVIDTVKNVKADKITSEHEKFICHYLLKLLDFQEDLQKRESKISKFKDVCNGYFESYGKKLIYDSSKFSFYILQNTNESNKLQEIELQHLSSGEKQIVSLFSHLFLSEQENFLIIIDEPELSLSVEWQRKFLQDIWESDKCIGLIAATHSPFIYENNLEKYAHGIGEFIVKS